MFENYFDYLRLYVSYSLLDLCQKTHLVSKFSLWLWTFFIFVFIGWIFSINQFVNDGDLCFCGVGIICLPAPRFVSSIAIWPSEKGGALKSIHQIIAIFILWHPLMFIGIAIEFVCSSCMSLACYDRFVKLAEFTEVLCFFVNDRNVNEDFDRTNVDHCEHCG